MSRLLRAALGAATLLLPAASPAQGDVQPAACAWSEECSTGGARLEMTVLGRAGEGRGTKVTLSPRVHGFAPGVVFGLAMRQLERPAVSIVTGYMLDSTGAVVCAPRRDHAAAAAEAGGRWCPVPLDSLRLDIGNIAQSEPVHFAVEALGGGQAAYATAYARPLRVTAQGCALTVEMVSADARAFRIIGTGFAGAETVATTSRSGDEMLSGELVTRTDGRLPPLIVTPGVRFKRGGEASYTVRGRACEVTVTYPWGRNVP